MNQISKITLIAGCLLIVSCSGTSDNQPNKNTTNAVSNSEPTTSANANTNAEKPTETGFELPTAKPIENGKPQGLNGITVTVPTNWKKIDGKEGWIKFQSPDKIELFVQRTYDLQPLDMTAEFIKLRKENPTYKAMMRAIDGELGILYLNEKNSIMNGDVLSWTTFPPPDAKGYAVKRTVMLICPAGTYEQNKQIMFDVLFSSKLQR